MLSKRLCQILNSQPKYQKEGEEIETLQLEVGVLRKEGQYLLTQDQELEGRAPVSTDDSQVCIA